jgi:type IV pilus assembly protein PilC
MVRTGEKSGSVDEMLNRLAEYYEGEAVAATQTLVTVGFVAMLMLVMVVGGFVVIRFWSGMYGSLVNMEL